MLAWFSVWSEVQTCTWPLPLTVCCFSKIQIGFTFLVPAHPGCPGQRAVKRLLLPYHECSASHAQMQLIATVAVVVCASVCVANTGEPNMPFGGHNIMRTEGTIRQGCTLVSPVEYNGLICNGDGTAACHDHYCNN